jgi:ATP-binding cassette subfamily B protein
MGTLYRYFKDLWKLAVVALVLAAINQIFSLLDPLIFRHIIDSYATRYREYSSPQFIRGVGLLLAAAVGVALVSRIAKNFQDYFVNVITQKVGARIYTDGVRHSLDLPYTLFEDQRSGETLGKLQRVRSDVEKFIALLVNMVFTTLIGLAFVTIYAAKVHWSIAPAYLLTVPLLGSLSSLLSRRVKTVQKRYRNGDDSACRCDDGILTEHRISEEFGPCSTGD